MERDNGVEMKDLEDERKATLDDGEMGEENV